jgi:hypothetical protein
VLPGFFQEHAIETDVECAVELLERVEVAVTEFACVISDIVCDHEQELEREHGGRHGDRLGAKRIRVEFLLGCGVGSGKVRSEKEKDEESGGEKIPRDDDSLTNFCST